MEILSASNYEKVATTTNHNITISIEKDGKSYDVLVHTRIYHAGNRGPLVSQRRILNDYQPQLRLLTAEEQKTIFAFAEKTILGEMEDNTKQIPQTLMVNVAFMTDEQTGDITFDEEGMLQEFEHNLNELVNKFATRTI